MAVYMEKEESDFTNDSSLHKILQRRFLTESTFVLRIDRGKIEFKSGQHIITGLKGELNQREYSIYSGEKDDYLEILVRVIPDGNVSLQLKQCEPGQLLEVNGPFGSFGIEKSDMFSGKLVFIATGTGISPFHSFVRSYPGIDYMLFHGVRYSEEAYERKDYDPSRYFLCTTGDAKSGHPGRVTAFFPTYPVSSDMLFYLCGNRNMIFEVDNLLRTGGVPAERIFTEIYF
jgi:ferredoxin--NADP+ reductase